MEIELNCTLIFNLSFRSPSSNFRVCPCLYCSVRIIQMSQGKAKGAPSQGGHLSALL